MSNIRDSYASTGPLEMTAKEFVQLAVAEDDIMKFELAIRSFKTLHALRFEHDMNLLNLAIDTESYSII